MRTVRYGFECLNPYEQLLASHKDLPKGVLLAHSVPCNAHGEFVVHRSRSRIGNWLADRLCLPPAGDLPVTLSVCEEDGRIAWRRTFDGRDYPATIQWSEKGLLHERAGPATFVFLLAREEDAIVYRQVAFRLFGLLLPPSLSVRVWAKVDSTPEGWHVKVTVRAPLVGTLCRYAGNMRSE